MLATDGFQRTVDKCLRVAIGRKGEYTIRKSLLFETSLVVIGNMLSSFVKFTRHMISAGINPEMVISNHTVFRPFVIGNTIDSVSSQIFGAIEPVRAKRSAPMLRIAAETALITSWISYPSFASNCIEQTGSINIRKNSPTENIISTISAVSSLPVVERIIEDLTRIDMRCT